MIDFDKARRGMVDTQLRTSNISDRRVLAAMGEVPREAFVPAARRELAYIDDATPLDAGQGRVLPPAAIVGKLLQLAEVGSTSKVLSVASGSGYAVALLSRLAAQVVGVESDPVLAARSREILQGLGYTNTTIIEGPLASAAQGAAPFDLVFLEGAVEAAPAAYFPLLADGGRLVALVRRGPGAVAHLYVKSGRDVASRSAFDGILPPLPSENRAEEFVF